MKKDIMNLLKSTDGTLRLNSISYLRRWTKDALDNDVDCLTIEFDAINGVRYSILDTKIESRDYEGIINECKKHTGRFMSEVSNKICKELSAGHRAI